MNNPVDDSQILQVPLAVVAGGRGHTGGDQFPSRDDNDFKTLRDWAGVRSPRSVTAAEVTGFTPRSEAIITARSG